MLLKILILLHLVGAAVWVGGHLVLALSVLPKALREKNPEVLKSFEERYEKAGIPSLVLQAVTGLWIASIYVSPAEWFSFSDRAHIHIGLKLIFLSATLLLAVHARLFIIPVLNTKNLPWLALHIVMMTIIALAMLFTGFNFRMEVL